VFVCKQYITATAYITMTEVAPMIDVEEMNTKMRVKETDDYQSLMSKKISYVVRYGVPDIDKVEHNGTHYYMLKQVLNLNIFQDVTEETFLEVVEQANQQKTRYEITEIDGENCIKAAGQRATDPVERAAQKAKRKEKKKALKDVLLENMVNEEEFARKWKLDALASQKLLELPIAQKQNAMLKFSPNSNVPNEDYSKLFVAFCKRFKARGAHDDGNGSSTPKEKISHPVPDAMPFCPGVPWYSTHGKTIPHTSPLQANLEQQGIMYGTQLGMQNMAMSNLYNSMFYDPMAAAAAFYMQTGLGGKEGYGGKGGYGGFDGGYNKDGGAKGAKGAKGSQWSKGGKPSPKGGKMGEQKFVPKVKRESDKSGGGKGGGQNKKESVDRKKSTQSQNTKKTDKSFTSAKSKNSGEGAGAPKGPDEVTIKSEKDSKKSASGSVKSGPSKKSAGSKKSKK